MKHTLQLAIVLSILSFSCKAQFDSYSVVTEHHLLSENNKVTTDSNQFDKKLLNSIFQTVKPKAGQDVLLIGYSDTNQPFLEFGVYNFLNNKFYYSLSRNGQHFFTDAVTQERTALLAFVTPMATDSIVTDEEAMQFVNNHKEFSISIIKLDKTKEQIYIKEYKW